MSYVIGGGGSGPQIGEIREFSASKIPNKWIECDGREVSRTVFAKLAALYAADGYPHGAGNGTTTFNIPDKRGRATIGRGQGTNLTSRALGDTGGAESHKLTTAEMPGHDHAGSTAESGGTHNHDGATTGATDGQHSHSGATTSSAGDHTHTLHSGSNDLDHNTENLGAQSLNWGTTTYQSLSSGAHTHDIEITGSGGHDHNLTTENAGAHTHALTIASQGGGGAHENMQPFHAGVMCVYAGKVITDETPTVATAWDATKSNADGFGLLYAPNKRWKAGFWHGHGYNWPVMVANNGRSVGKFGMHFSLDKEYYLTAILGFVASGLNDRGLIGKDLVPGIGWNMNGDVYVGGSTFNEGNSLSSDGLDVCIDFTAGVVHLYKNGVNVQQVNIPIGEIGTVLYPALAWGSDNLSSSDFIYYDFNYLSAAALGDGFKPWNYGAPAS